MANKKKDLLQSYKHYIFIPAIAVASALVLTIVLLSVFAYAHIVALVVIIDVLAALILGAYIFFYFYISKKVKETCYRQLFETTYININKIKNNDSNLLSYGESDIREIQMLDKVTSDVRTKLESSYLLLKSPDYSNIPLEYVDESIPLITYKSFRDNIANIIFVSQSYKNLILEVFFNLPNGTEIPNEDKTRLLNLYRETFCEHERVLFMFSEDNRSIIIYLPVIDSFSEIREKLNHVVANSSIMIRDERGIKNILAKYALVAYPYSNEEMILGDLRYAKQQDKPYNLYLPKRIRSNVGSKLLLNTSMSLNYTSKIISELSELDYSAANNEKNDALLKHVFEAIAEFLDIDEAGVIAYNESMDRYYSYVSNANSELFGGKENINKDFVESLSKAVDEDGIFYFSKKKHASIAIQPTLGLYGIQSGIYYAIKNLEENKIIALVYMFNRNRDLNLTTYLRETFFVVSLRIENYFEKREIADYADAKETENENILALSNLYVYHIDDDYNLTYLSKGAKRHFNKMAIGDKCYHAFFGYEKRCRDCPYATKKKKYFEVKGDKYETSLTLSDRKDNERVLVIKQVENHQIVGDLYQEDFLVYSYKALVNTVKNEYAANSRGYVLLLTIDNYEEILKKIGSEGYNYLIRDYVRSLKNKLAIEDVYYYNPSTLAIHLPTMGHKDVITKIESIYPLSKEQYYDNDDLCKLNISYLSIGYPRGYALAEDYLKHMSDFYHSRYAKNKDFIYFSDFSIERSASKREFMIATLEKEFSGHNSTSMSLQPIVRAKDEHITGAEILLRIADAHRNVFFNAQEISRIAEQEKKTGMITESIINFIGTMYKEYGNNIFKINKFNRIAINIDQTYLDDEELLTKLISLCEENNLPNGFISLEIPEDLVPNNKDKIRLLANQLAKYKILFSCDRYIGQYVDTEELAYLGFNEVKIARDIILTIDSDQVKYNTLKSIVEAAKKNGVALAAVGVENAAQLKLLRELDDEMLVQGYYLYKPLSRADLIAALISYEK